MGAPQGESGLFTPAGLKEVARWSIWIAVGIAIVGGAITRDWRFVAGCALGAAVDIAVLYWIVGRIGSVTDVASATTSISATFVAGRIVLKALVLLAAFALPAYLDLWGALCGVLVTDLTLMTVGAVESTRAAFPRTGTPRQ